MTKLTFSWHSLVLLFFSLLSVNSCSLIKLPAEAVHCKCHTYINLGLEDYLSERFSSGSLVRLGIIPFDVQESFAPPGNDSVHYGRGLAKQFSFDLKTANIIPVVELFNRDRWPGKREEFFTGNYQAISSARAAGYDLVMVGYLEEIKDANSLTLYTKIIDTQNNITVWDAKTVVESKAREYREALSEIHLAQKRPELFDFPVKSKELVNCTVDEMSTYR